MVLPLWVVEKSKIAIPHYFGHWLIQQLVLTFDTGCVQLTRDLFAMAKLLIILASVYLVDAHSYVNAKTQRSFIATFLMLF